MFKISTWILSVLLVTGISLTTQGQEPTKDRENRIEQFAHK